MHKLVTRDGWEFYADSFVKVNGEYVSIHDLNAKQKSFVAASLNVKGLNAAYRGEAVFYAEGLQPVDKVFSELNEEST